MRTRKNSRVLSHLRYLCNLGIRSEWVVPALVPELRRLIPFDAYAFAWSAPDGRLVNTHSSPMRPDSLRYLAEHYEQIEADIGFSTEHIMLRFPAVVSMRTSKLMNPDYDRTSTFRALWEPEFLYWVLMAIVRTSDGVPLAQLQLFRPREARDFDTGDEQAMEAVLPYLRHMLLADHKAKDSTRLLPDPKVGLAVLGADGDSIFVSSRARALCVRAFNGRMPVTDGDAGLKANDDVDALRTMQREVAAASCALGGTAGGAVSHARRIVNEWGTFTFDWQPAEAAESTDGSAVMPAASWGVIIREYLPMPLLLLAEFERMGLSDRQSEVCRRLIEGEPTPDIARELGISRETLRDHVREVYRRAGVRDRESLIRRMLAAAH